MIEARPGGGRLRPSRAAGLGALVLAACLGGSATSPGQAGDHRLAVIPSRDVAVTYRAADVGEHRLAWLVAEGKVRMDLPGGAAVHDMPANVTTVLMPELRAFVRAPGEPGQGLDGPGVVRPGERLVREGTARIADHDCTDWRVEAAGGGPEARRVCMTEDGVPLRIARTRDGTTWTEALAVRVEYGPQDPARFRVPEGYRPLDPGALGPPRQRR